MMWGCLFPNARSTHMRRAGAERGTPFLLQAAGLQVGTSAQRSVPTAHFEPTKLHSSLSWSSPKDPEGPSCVGDLSKRSTMVYSTLGY